MVTFASLSKAASLSIVNDESLNCPRSSLLSLGGSVGCLCSLLAQCAPLDEIEDDTFATSNNQFWVIQSESRDQIFMSIANVFWSVILLAEICGVDLKMSILKKMELNNRKYPVHLCKGKSGKYTIYSTQTGITKTNQSTTDIKLDHEKKSEDSLLSFSMEYLESLDSIKEMTAFIRKFAINRKWTKYHTPRSLCLALMGEMGELSELFQWKTDIKGELSKTGWSTNDIDHVQQELADVSIYCLRLADVIGIPDIGEKIIRILE